MAHGLAVSIRFSKFERYRENCPDSSHTLSSWCFRRNFSHWRTIYQAPLITLQNRHFLYSQIKNKIKKKTSPASRKFAISFIKWHFADVVQFIRISFHFPIIVGNLSSGKVTVTTLKRLLLISRTLHILEIIRTECITRSYVLYVPLYAICYLIYGSMDIFKLFFNTPSRKLA